MDNSKLPNKDNKDNVGGKRRMAVSMGAILGIKGETAKQIRDLMKSPSKRQEYFNKNEKKAEPLKKK